MLRSLLRSVGLLVEDHLWGDSGIQDKSGYTIPVLHAVESQEVEEGAVLLLVLLDELGCCVKARCNMQYLDGLRILGPDHQLYDKGLAKQLRLLAARQEILLAGRSDPFLLQKAPPSGYLPYAAEGR